MSPKSKAFGTTELARMCHVTPPTVGRWIEEGKLPYFTTGGGHRRVWASDVVAFLREHNIPIPEELQAGGKTKVLIVDDEESTRRLISRVLLESYPQAEIHEAADGFEAGRKITQMLPALVILDVMLPGMDGLKVCKMIRSDPRLNGIRILAISGYDAEETRKSCLQAGADDFLGKPFDLQELKKRLTRFIGAGPRSRRPLSKDKEDAASPRGKLGGPL